MQYFHLISFIVFISFSAFPQPESENAKMNRITIDEETGEHILIGLTTRAAFGNENFSGWFRDEYYDYETDKNIIDQLTENFKDIYIFIIMGTWSDNSRILVPGLFKVLDEIYYPKEKIKIVNVDRNIETGGKELDGLNITSVPVIVFYKGAEEIGRIVESPESTIEEDMLDIIKNPSKDIIN